MTDEVPALSTRDLTIRFGGQVAVNSVTCAFHRGTLTAIVGPNGAGKTTYFNLISGPVSYTHLDVYKRQVEPWDFTDIDRTVQAGVSITGKQWGRPDDTIGIAGVINGLAPVHAAYFAAGGMGVLIGDGQLPNYGLEQIIETYYSYAITSTTKVSFDYQFIANPAYNTQRGPVNVFAGRFHTAF